MPNQDAFTPEFVPDMDRPLLAMQQLGQAGMAYWWRLFKQSVFVGHIRQGSTTS